MKVRHRRFIDEYCIDGNGAAAAVRAGYDADSAKQTAYRLLNTTEIADAIKVKHAQLTMSAEEAAKHDSDIARTRLNDFLEIKYVQAREWSEQYVSVLLEACNEEIDLIREFINDNQLTEDQRKPFEVDITSLQKKALEYQMDILRWGPTVTRLAAGKPIIKEVAELNLVALAKAKDVGRIAEYSSDEKGTRVKMYAADAAIARILKMHGKLVDTHDHKSSDGSMTPKGLTIDPNTLTEDQLSTLLDVIRSNETNE